MKQDTSYWDERRNKIVSKIGGWIIGEGVYSHGVDLLADSIGKLSYMQIRTLNVTGKLPTPTLVKWMEAVYICQSWPDPRIWCNHVSALGAEAQCNVIAATAAGLQAGSSELYATGPILRSANFITSAMEKFKSGMSVPDIVESEVKRSRGNKVDIVGFSRPIAKGDERVELLWALARDLGFAPGPHETLAREIEEYLSNTYDEQMNVNGCVAAFMSDQGYTGMELYLLGACLVSSGVEACYVDYMDRPEGSFLPIRCDDLEYVGKAIRPVPDSLDDEKTV